MAKFGISKGHKCQNLVFQNGLSDKVFAIQKGVSDRVCYFKRA